MKESDNVVIVFMKFPDAGRVKTRLGKQCGFMPAALVYRRCVEYLMPRISGAVPEGTPIRIAFEPPQWKPLFKEWLKGDYEWTPQPTGNLGRRLRQICHEAFAEGKRKVLIFGSDTPTLKPEWITQAFKELETHDAVIGPASDGGYYAIGFSRPAESVFMKVNWSSDTVYEQTVKKLEQLKMTYAQLPEHYDIDTYRDVLRLREELLAEKSLDEKGKALLDTIQLISEIQEEEFSAQLEVFV